jgi:single-strand DNA-binding protein
LTRDPELRFTPTGQATATFPIVVNRTWTDRQSQERKESTSFFDVVAWDPLAENADPTRPPLAPELATTGAGQSLSSRTSRAP